MSPGIVKSCATFKLRARTPSELCTPIMAFPVACLYYALRKRARKPSCCCEINEKAADPDPDPGPRIGSPTREDVTERQMLLPEAGGQGKRLCHPRPRPQLCVVVEKSPHSSYKRGCQEKRLLPAPRRDAGGVTYIQPSHSRKGDWLAALARRRLQRRCQPQLLVVPTQRFHDVVVLDTIRFRSYAS